MYNRASTKINNEIIEKLVESKPLMDLNEAGKEENVLSTTE